MEQAPPPLLSLEPRSKEDTVEEDLADDLHEDDIADADEVRKRQGWPIQIIRYNAAPSAAILMMRPMVMQPNRLAACT
jgi:hypothetical protein